MNTRHKLYSLYLVLFVLIIFFSGCDKGETGYDSGSTTSECIQPNNPYNDGGGHDAGFNWAVENGGGCNGNSDSFNEGCEEYYRQLSQYNECIARKR